MGVAREKEIKKTTAFNIGRMENSSSKNGRNISITGSPP
jgi:hypothetical protein